MQLQKSATIDTPIRRMIEMTFADEPNPGQTAELLTFRITVAPEGYPGLLEVQLDGLRHVQKIIDALIHRLELIRDQLD